MLIPQLENPRVPILYFPSDEQWLSCTLENLGESFDASTPHGPLQQPCEQSPSSTILSFWKSQITNRFLPECIEASINKQNWEFIFSLLQNNRALSAWTLKLELEFTSTMGAGASIKWNERASSNAIMINFGMRVCLLDKAKKSVWIL